MSINLLILVRIIILNFFSIVNDLILTFNFKIFFDIHIS